MKRHRSTQVRGHVRNLPPAYDEAVHEALLCDASTYEALIGNQCVRALRAGMSQLLLEEKAREAARAEFYAQLMKRAA